jgi:MYXO-CTERM domain-containing protein
MMFRSRCFFGFVLAAIFAALAVLLPSVAFAGGSVQAKSLNLDEVDGKWHLKLTIDLGSMPDLPHVPMDFIFTPTVYDEFACDDQHGDKPFHNAKPLTNQQSITLPTEVGFSDGTGKTFQKTNYDFVIRRDDRFEAGTYTLEIKRDGSPIGGRMTVVLKGDNIVVNRKSMVLGEKPKKDDPCNPRSQSGSTAPASSSTPSDAPPPKSSGSGGDTAPASSGDGSGDKSTGAGDSSGAVPPKQGGCGCKVAGETDVEGAGAALTAAAAAIAFATRRRRLRSTNERRAV